MAVERQGLAQTKIVNEIMKIGHGNLDLFLDVGSKAVDQDPEFFAHLTAWNEKKGEVRDSKKAFPVIGLRGHPGPGGAFYENAVAHMCLLDPRDMLESVRMHMGLHSKRIIRASNGARKMFNAGVTRYVREREKSRAWFNGAVVQHRKSMVNLYRIMKLKPSSYAKAILFDKKYPEGSVFDMITKLKSMTERDTANAILKFKIPHLVAVGAIGAGLKNKPDIVFSMIEQMSPAEVITNTKMLKDCGVFENPLLKAAYDNKIADAQKDRRTSTLKAGRAAKAVASVSRAAAKKLESAQEARLDSGTRIKGDVLILGDMSGSMEISLEASRVTASLIARKCDGEVTLAFFNTSYKKYDVTGKTLEQIKQETSHLRANGGTSIGCALAAMAEIKKPYDIVVVCSDGADNRSPYFHEAYIKYVSSVGIEPTIYLMRFPGERNVMGSYCERVGISVNTYEFPSKVDEYSLINVINLIKPGSYALYEEIMAVPLLTLDGIFSKK